MISNRIKDMNISATLAMAAKSRELSEKGVDVINLSLGQPDFNVPDFIKESAKKAIDENHSKYTPVDGYKELKKTICEKLKRDNNLEYQLENIVVSTGAKQSLANVFMSIINPGDEIIIFAPYWVTYIEQVQLFEGVPVIINSDINSDYKINPNELINSITSKTKAIIFSSPSNPTGELYSRNELEEIAKIMKNYPNVLIISDEIYELINFSSKHESIAQFDYIRDRVIIVNGLSKGFAAPGWRLGYIAAPTEIAKACIKAQGQITSGPCSIIQIAANTAFSNSPKLVEYMKIEFEKRKNIIVNKLSEIKGLLCNNPKGAFYVFPDISHFFGKKYKDFIINNAEDISIYLLEEANVATVSGEAFGSKNNIRISYAISTEDLIIACDRIKLALEKLS